MGKQVYKLATQLEKEKLLEEQKMFREAKAQKKQQADVMVSAIEGYYKDKINMLKDKIGNERFERQLAKQAQQKVTTIHL